MDWRFSIVPVIFLASAAVASVTAALVRHRRHTPGAKSMAWMMAAAGWWSLLGGLELASTSLRAKIVLSQVYYPGAVGVPVLFLFFALRYTRPDRPLRQHTILALWIVPIVSVLLAWTNDLHRLIWPRVTLDEARNVALYEHGPWFYVLMVYLWALVIAATALLLTRAVRGVRPFSRQALVLVLGVPWSFIPNVLYVAGFSPVPGVDLAPIGFIVSGVTLSLGLRWLRLFDLIPIAREAVLDQIKDGVLVLDAEARIVEANRASHALLGEAERVQVGTTAGPIVAAWLQSLVGSPTPLRLECRLGEAGRHVDVRGEALRGRNGSFRGWLLLLQDVTEREQAREALAARVRELEEALAQVRTLKGLVPICGHCKRIRNDSNFWEQLESYLMEHTDAEFSHGICPDCYKREIKKARELAADKLPPP
jgi:PAS domain-containing protein